MKKTKIKKEKTIIYTKKRQKWTEIQKWEQNKQQKEETNQKLRNKKKTK